MPLPPSRTVVRQVDLDTCLTGWLLGASAAVPVTHAPRGASEHDLADPAVLCLEAGGSGETGRSNFDHHDTPQPLPPACLQALALVASPSPAVRRLSEYVALVDEGRIEPSDERVSFPTLSALFSGMRLVEPDAVSQFRAGLAILQQVAADGLDPFGTMPDRAEWRAYRDRKRAELDTLEHDAALVSLFETRAGRLGGYLESGAIGAIGAIYHRGAVVAVAFSPTFQPTREQAPRRKFTIAGRQPLRVDGLLDALRVLEPGWGGPAHGTIVASPVDGSTLSPVQVIDVVRQGL